MKKQKMCRGCENPAKLLRYRDAGYPYYSDYGPVWICLQCQAWVGCHKGTTNALGGLANAELRKLKQDAHAVFDPLWRRKIENEKCSKSMARRAGYKWLSEQMAIPFERTHIGYMNPDECRKVIEICSRFYKK